MLARKVFLGILVALAMTGQAHAQSAEDDIKAVDAMWVAAFQKGDIDTIASIYAPNGVLMPPNASTAEGREAVAAVWAGWGELPGVAINFAPDSIKVSESGDMAADIGHYTFAFDTENGRFEDQGKYLVVWNKIDGQWQIIADMFNSNLPPPGAE